MEPLFIAVLAFSAISVSRAEESLSLFVRKGGSVHLDVQGYEKLQFSTLDWQFNSIAILKYIIGFKMIFYEDYETRAEFEKNFTLLLKNVQE
uniref:Uncharacterized protein n=1 Tax=Anguilla anguilla TaxID=7936 RepID=A0A0E9XEY7_ANGAN